MEFNEYLDRMRQSILDRMAYPTLPVPSADLQAAPPEATLGYGSENTKVRRFTSSLDRYNPLNDETEASADDGATWTPVKVRLGKFTQPEKPQLRLLRELNRITGLDVQPDDSMEYSSGLFADALAKLAPDDERARILAKLETLRPMEQPYTRREWAWEQRGARELFDRVMRAISEPAKGGDS